MMTPIIHSGSELFNQSATIIYYLLVSYPILGSFAWFIGVLCYTFLFKYKHIDWAEIPAEIEPLITIMVPAHNEEVVIEDTINYLMTNINYGNYEVLVTDDGSTDQTPAILARLQKNIRNYVSFGSIRIKEKHMLLILGWHLLKDV